MVRNVLCTLALGVVALTGCATSQPGDEAPRESATVTADTQAQALWAHRTAYLGNTSKVIALMDDAGFGPPGTYSLSLWTTRPPYAVTITVSDAGKPFGLIDFTGPATLLLGTVGNLGTVHVAGQGQTWTLTAREATGALGHDVKTLGTDRAALVDYVRTLQD